MPARMRVSALLPALLAASCLKAPDPSGMSGPAAEAGPPPVVDLSAPADWRAVPPDLSFYLAKWELPDGGLATLSWLGPGDDPDFLVQNVQRWLNEWQTPAGEPVPDYSFETLQNGAHKMHRIGLTGTLTGVRQLGGGEPRVGWSLDGVVVETPRGTLFFKLIGPAGTVAGQRDAVWTMLGTLALR
jgi:hypothetical protein